ncbi:transcriptional regulator [Acidovorax sp. CF316]|uniref:TetR/AcrR family transcriptional regulator n=1 Tax=Acidovorax sp. CF316 TaxID=1144317 RepID=UPI00026BDBE7|nr:TetR/AcrR family transcriptional regulator [Acidovorax sp. CF316]EJE50022.1 transcriptional regulator [Acidovorax sp. CF316]
MRTLNPAQHQARRQHILAAAVECFMRKGFHGTRTAEICAEAGMSPGNLFHYFPTKEAIIAAIVEEDQRETAERFAQAAHEQNLYQALLGILEDSLALLADPVYTRIGLEVLAEGVRNPAVMACVAQGEAVRKAALVQLLEAAVERGQVRLSMPAAQAADWVLLLLDGAFGRAMVEVPFDSTAYRTLVLAALATVIGPLA